MKSPHRFLLVLALAAGFSGAARAQTVYNPPFILWAPGVAAGSTDGFVYQNPTASTSGATVQNSPDALFIAHAWNTTSTAADNWLQMKVELRGTSGSTPTSTYVELCVTSGASDAITINQCSTWALNL